MTELLPCPFCGGEADLDEIPGSPFTTETYSWGAGCKDCNIGWYNENKAEAIAAWNKRAVKLNMSVEKLATETTAGGTAKSPAARQRLCLGGIGQGGLSMDTLLKTYPFNLAKSIFQNDEDALGIYLPGIEQALATLTEREVRVIRQRFVEKKTLKDTGITEGISQERVRQIEAKAIRKLRHPSRAALIKAVPYTELKAHWADYHKLKAEYDQVSAAYQALSDRPAEEVVRENDILQKPLENLDLSARSFNSLRRAGKNTVGDVSKMTEVELSKVRNLGRKSAEEVKARLAVYGLALSGGGDAS
jgi:Lar family restriction alleviation protein